jgi:hypothetical protein
MIDQILIEICRKGSIYDEIIENFIGHKKDYKLPLISEISLSYLENSEKIEKIYEEGWFKYYFLNTVRNQLFSSTSSFFKNNRIKDFGSLEIPDVIDDTTIEDKIDFEEKLDSVMYAYAQVKKNWFDNEMFQQYYTNGLTYRAIEKEYGVDHCLAWHNINRTKNKIKKYLKVN